jgi:hypothetical protein
MKATRPSNGTSNAHERKSEYDRIEVVLYY